MYSRWSSDGSQPVRVPLPVDLNLGGRGESRHQLKVSVRPGWGTLCWGFPLCVKERLDSAARCGNVQLDGVMCVLALPPGKFARSLGWYSAL